MRVNLPQEFDRVATNDQPASEERDGSGQTRLASGDMIQDNHARGGGDRGDSLYAFGFSIRRSGMSHITATNT
jgi:hypothetical protein